jgi:hypothetical protein
MLMLNKAMAGQKANFPWYFTIDKRPVKVVATADGGMDVLVLNSVTGELERNLEYLARCFEPGKDVERISEEEFIRRLAALKEEGHSADK